MFGRFHNRAKHHYLLAVIFLAVFLLSGCSSKPTYDDGYDVGYDDGYDDGRTDNQSEQKTPEDIAFDQVYSNPEYYCNDYSDEKIKAYTNLLKERLICREK